MSDLGNVSGFSNNESKLMGTKEFLESNSLVAKTAFLLLVVVVFVILLRIGISFLTWVMSYSTTPHLIDGMIDGKQMRVIEVDPNEKGSKPITRSDDENDGIEFTWSVWLYVDDMDYKKGQYRHIFHKGNDNINLDSKPYGINFPNNAPGLYLAPDTNDLVVVMNTFDHIEEKITVKNYPLNKWFNVMIRAEGLDCDVYINGTITNKHILKSVPKQNYDKVYMSLNGGFSGHTSNLWYWNYALGTTEMQHIIDKGPNMTILGDDMMQGKPRYFSLRWFFRNTNSIDSGYGGF
tara:strand:+ start:995 stop:1870 length:876 start_codon:yes stop_codon:yes gene_type:complete